MGKEKFKVLIIGGGIAGPALALALKQAGIASGVFEAYPYGEGIGGGFNIAPNGMNVLASLGVAQQLMARTTSTRRSIFKDERGRELAKLPYGDAERFGQPALTMSRATLFQCLAESMKAQGIQVEYTKRLTSIQEDPSGVTAHFEDGTFERGDILIGADGLRSVVRNAILPMGPRPEFTGMLGVCGFVPRAAVSMTQQEVEGITFTFGPKGFFGHGGGDQGTILWWANMMSATPYSSEEITRIDQEAVRSELLARFGKYYSPIPELIAQTPKILRMNTFDIPSLPTWHKGRVLLIGDAAHAVSPNSGQGASLALEDALYLAKLLSQRLDQLSASGSDTPLDHTGVFAAFQEGRKDRVEKIIQEGRRRSRGKEEVSVVQSRIRNFFIGLMIRTFGTKGQEELFGYRVDWPGANRSASETGREEESITRADLRMRAARPGYP